MRRIKEKRGITLIALVVTIIVLLILAGVSIAMLTGENGLLTQAENAKSKTDIAGAKEEIEMAVLKCIDYTTGRLKPAGESKRILEEFVGENGSVTDTDGEYPLTVVYKGYIFEVKSNKKVELITGIRLNKSKLQIKVGDEESKELKVTKSSDIKEEIVWSIIDDKSGGEIKVSNGQVTIGDATVGMKATVKATAGIHSAECQVEVVNALETIEIVGMKPKTLKAGQTSILEVKTTPSENVEDLIYESSDKNIAEVDQSGKITGIKEGTVTITVRGSISTNKSAEHILTVKKPFDVTAVLPPNAVVSQFEGEHGDATDGINDEAIVIYIMKDTNGDGIADTTPNWKDKATMQKTYDQFVWVPVEDAVLDLTDDPSTVEKETDYYSTLGNNDVKAKVREQIDNEIYPMAIKTDETNYIGVQYDFKDSTTGNKVDILISSDWKPKYNSGENYCREPDILPDNSYADGKQAYLNEINSILGYKSTEEKYISNANKFKERLQKEYNEMVKSVENNGGFWIGRYETSNMRNDTTTETNNQVQVKIIKGADNSNDKTSLISDVSWYRMYAEQGLYSGKAKLNGITSSMIWRSQWDQVMIWMKDVPSKEEYREGTYNTYKYSGTHYITNALGMGNYGVPSVTKDGETKEVKDGKKETNAPYATGTLEDAKVKNIYDMAGNVDDWTLGACYTYARDLMRKPRRKLSQRLC